ncbi:MAG TPA: HEAT repeat domain-containing protein, partial [Thermoanaerobaculia bacterium]|nr:HEAT repeat domain-containing protein [Thermoanaerobaculia bacterium]
KNVEQPVKSGASPDMFGMSYGGRQPHAIWYNSLALLRDLGKKDATRRRDVVAALTPVAQTARPAVRLAAGLALVDLGSDAGREALIRGFESESGPISSDPSDQMTFPGRYPYDESSITACAHALARLGDRRGLRHPNSDVRLAAAEALTGKSDPDVRKMLEDLAKELEPDVDKLMKKGELTAPRSPGDYTNRYPANWVRTQRLLALRGDDRAFRQLVEAFLVDAGTYPREEAPLLPTLRLASWSNGPSPAQAILGTNDSVDQVLGRLRRLFEQDERWNSLPLKMLRTSLEEPGLQETKKAPQIKATEAEIEKLLDDSDPNRRAEGLAAAGYYRVDSFYAKVLDKVQTGTTIERRAAIYSLGFYGREVPDEVLRTLMRAEDIDLRSGAVELATRKNAARFARETMDLVRSQLAHAKDTTDDGETQSRVAYLPRLVSRLARGPIPQPMLDGLEDPDPKVRRIVVQALELSGNPDAIPDLVRLSHDPDSAVREAAEKAIRFLGPEG